MTTPSPPSFLVRGFDLEALEREEATLVALDATCAITWVNPVWTRFAQANDGADVVQRFGPGASYLDGIAPPLREFYESAFARTLRTGVVFEQDYECSSPETFRKFHLRALPVDGQGLLLEHSLVVERPHIRHPVPIAEPTYTNGHGLILQCSNCRRVRRARGRSWDWVPAWVSSPPKNTSHGLCVACAGYYWR